nr:DUF1453 domain-containing protein [Oleiagrimonas soli]
MTYAIAVPIVALLIGRRISRQFGRQPVRRKRMIARIAILAVLAVSLGLSGLHDPRLLEGLAGGIGLGALVGFVGLRLTTWTVDPKLGDCYIPNRWIGALLTALLLGRLAWRFIVVWPQIEDSARAAGVTPIQHASTPLTLLVFGLLVGYYIVYYAGLLMHHRRFLRAARDGAATPPV